ncbi:MAG TPA: iron-containing alcohol dehydrogenase [Reyranella sp.]|nr:iron-containing alcohol dehydrogenase [Reyranella sp.]
MSAPVLRLSVPLPRLVGPAEVLAGEGALVALRTLPAARVAVVATERAARSPALQRWLENPGPFEVRHLTPSWSGEPAFDALSGTVGELADYGPDWIVAVGGGSVLDGAKLCWARYEHPRFPVERLSRPFALPRLRAKARFVAVPTTSGTGSENSSAAVFVDTQSGHKVPVVTHDFLPDITVLEPRLTSGLSVRWTVLTALDALAHALEGRVSTLTNPLVDGLAESSAIDIVTGLTRFLSEGDGLEVRGRLQIAAFHAGQVQNLRLVGVAHAIAHQLGKWHVPHAVAIGVLLPIGMEEAMRADSVRAVYDRIGRACGLEDGRALAGAIAGLRDRAGLPNRLGEATGVPSSIADDDVERLTGMALSDPIARFMPVKMQPDELAGLIRRAW